MCYGVGRCPVVIINRAPSPVMLCVIVEFPPQLRVFFGVSSSFLSLISREFTQPRRQRRQERHKFAYLTVKNNRFSRFARAFFIFGHSADDLVLSTT